MNARASHKTSWIEPVERGQRYALVALLALTACAPPRRVVVQSEPLPPPLPIEQLATAPAEVSTALPFGGPLISLQASNADVRTLLSQLAAAAGLNLVIGPEVRGRVSVNFDNVPAMDALQAVVEEAGLTLTSGTRAFATVKAYFYQPPTNVNVASSSEIAARFKTTPRMADWIVASRGPFVF